jgi:phosphoglycolate phosphatase
MRRRFLIFDFDGTLADTFDLFLKVFDETAALHGFSCFDRENIDYLRTLDARNILRHHDVPMWKLPMIMRTTRKLMARRIRGIRLFGKIDQALIRLHEKGATLALLTSNSRSNVLRVLGSEMAGRFTHLECDVSIFNKHSKLKKMLARSGFTSDESIFIGDEIRDARAALQAGITFGAVSWGYGAMSALVKAGAQEYFFEPSELTSKLIA